MQRGTFCPWQKRKTKRGERKKPIVPAGGLCEEVAGYFWILNPEGSEPQKTIPIDAAWDELVCRMVKTEVPAGAQYIWGFGKGLFVRSGNSGTHC